MQNKDIDSQSKKDKDLIEEKCVLSILLHHNINYQNIHPKLEDYFFISSENQNIFLWIKEQNEKINLGSLFYCLTNVHKQDKNYVSSIFEELHLLFIEKLANNPEENLSFFATALARKRQYMKFSEEFSEKIKKISENDTKEVSKFFVDIGFRAQAICESLQKPNKAMEELRVVTEIFEAWEEKEQKLAIATPFQQLNDLLGGGFKERSVIVVGARPNIGKTSFAVNLALHFAMHELKENQRVCFWSLEDEREITCRKFLKKYLQGDNYEENKELALKKLSKLPVMISGLKEEDFRQVIRELRQEQKLYHPRVIIIDYINTFFKDNGKEVEKLVLLPKIMGELRALALECNSSIIVTAQLNRQSDAREEKMPRLSELKDSGSLEERADVVLLLHRDYPSLSCKAAPKETQKRIEHENLLIRTRNQAQIILAKNKEGETANIEALFWGEGGGFYPFSIEMQNLLEEKNKLKKKNIN